jgi:hypothetical protein
MVHCVKHIPIQNTWEDGYMSVVRANAQLFHTLSQVNPRINLSLSPTAGLYIARKVERLQYSTCSFREKDGYNFGSYVNIFSPSKHTGN